MNLYKFNIRGDNLYDICEEEYIVDIDFVDFKSSASDFKGTTKSFRIIINEIRAYNRQKLINEII